MEYPSFDIILDYVLAYSVQVGCRLALCHALICSHPIIVLGSSVTSLSRPTLNKA